LSRRDYLDSVRLDENQMIYAFAFVLVDIHVVEHGIADDAIDRDRTFRNMCVSICMLLRSLSRQP